MVDVELVVDNVEEAPKGEEDAEEEAAVKPDPALLLPAVAAAAAEVEGSCP